MGIAMTLWTCRTDGCENYGVGIPIDVPENVVVVCGVCGNEIEEDD